MSFSWSALPRPVVGLSAMDGVTDAAMREITKKIGNPDFMVTEFTSADGLIHGVRKLLRDFYYTENQRPIIAQIFGANPDSFYTCAIICCFLGFDGIDINMGCPADSIAKKGGGASLILNPKLAKEIVCAVQRGVKDWTNGIEIDKVELPVEFVKSLEQRKGSFDFAQDDRLIIPVSVKTRIGYDKPITLEWVRHLLETEPAVITLHGRTLEQQYGGEANWEEITKASEFVHSQTDKTLLFGNGDLSSLGDVRTRVEQSHVDGVWVGRAAMGNPMFFTGQAPTISQRLAVALDHCKIFEEFNQTVFKDDPYPFLNMRRHLGWYVKGFRDATTIRARLYQTNSYQEVKSLLDEVSDMI